MPSKTSLRLVAATAAACALIPAVGASAAQLGATAPDGSPMICADTGFTLFGLGDAYRAPAAGVITSMHSGQFGPFGTAVKFRVFRETVNGTAGVATAATTTGIDKRAGVNTRIPVEEGDRLGISKGPGAFPVACAFASPDKAEGIVSLPGDIADGVPFTSQSAFGARPNVAATLEPDADADGFGDESQDGCPVDGATQGACPPPPPPAAPAAPAEETPVAPADGPAPTPAAAAAPAATTIAGQAGCRLPRLRGLTVKKARRKLRAAHCASPRVKRARDARGRLTVRRATKAGTRIKLVVA